MTGIPFIERLARSIDEVAAHIGARRLSLVEPTRAYPERIAALERQLNARILMRREKRVPSRSAAAPF